jgi:hypothetical protein
VNEEENKVKTKLDRERNGRNGGNKQLKSI